MGLFRDWASKVSSDADAVRFRDDPEAFVRLVLEDGGRNMRVVRPGHAAVGLHGGHDCAEAAADGAAHLRDAGYQPVFADGTSAVYAGPEAVRAYGLTFAVVELHASHPFAPPAAAAFGL